MLLKKSLTIDCVRCLKSNFKLRHGLVGCFNHSMKNVPGAFSLSILYRAIPLPVSDYLSLLASFKLVSFNLATNSPRLSCSIFTGT